MTERERWSWPGPLHPGALAVLAVAITVLAAAGVLPRWQGLIHLVALPPVALVADLQLVMVRAPGPVELVVGVLASLGLRSAVLAWLLGGLTWARWGFGLRFHLAVLPLALAAAGLRFSSMAVLFYALFWVGAVLTVLLLALSAAAPLVPAALGDDGVLRLRRGFADALRNGLRLGTVGAYLAGLLTLGVLADLGGDTASVALVPASAALTWVAAWWLHADPGHRLARRAVAAVPAAGSVALALVVLQGPAEPATSEVPAPGQEGSILLMSGIDSSSGSGAILELEPTSFLGWPCERTFHFSYAGPGDGQPRGAARCPIDHGAPYAPQDTLRSRGGLVDFLDAFTAEMPPPVVVAAHSQGAWLAWEAAAAGRLPGVDVVVLVGVFPENPVAYPPRGERGPGGGGRYLLDLLEDLPRPGGTTVFEADSPLGREWLGHPDAVEEVMGRPLPTGVRALAITSAFDLPLVHGSHRVEGATDACPVGVMHPNVPYARELQEAIAAFARGEDLPSCPRWRTAMGPLFRHLSPPPS